MPPCRCPRRREWRPSWLPALVLLWTMLASASPALAAAPPVDCYLRCLGKAGDPNCVVKAGQGTSEFAVTEPPKAIADCPNASLVVGPRGMEGLVRSTAGVKRFKVNEQGKPFREAVGKLFADASCLGQHPACAESRDLARMAAAAGKGIGSFSFRRVGSPCLAGLPCGSVMRPAGPLSFEVQGVSSGRFRLQPAGGAAREWPIEGGRVTLEADALAAGIGYAYSVFDAAGAELMAGGFEVLSTRMQAGVQKELDAAGKADGGAALFDKAEILLDSDLWWDAARLR